MLDLDWKIGVGLVFLSLLRKCVLSVCWGGEESVCSPDCAGSGLEDRGGVGLLVSPEEVGVEWDGGSWSAHQAVLDPG